MQGKYANATATFLLFCTSFFCALALCELIARKYDVAFVQQRSHRYTLGSPDYAVKGFRPSSELGWEHVPNSYNFNSLGFPNPEYPQRKPPGTFRMVLLGDSLADSYGSDLLAEIGRDQAAANRTELWNLGVGAYNMAQYAATLEHKGLSRQPDLVVTFICMNDLYQDIPVIYNTGTSLVALNRNYSEPVRMPLGDLLWQRSALYRRFMISWLEAHRSRNPLPSRESFGEANLLKIKHLCEKNGIPLVMFVFPYMKPLRDYSEEQLGDYRTILKLLQRCGIDYFDLHGKFSDELLELRDSPADYYHFSPEGRAKAMKIVYAILKKHKGQKVTGSGPRSGGPARGRL